MHFPPEVFNIIKEFLLGIPFEETEINDTNYLFSNLPVSNYMSVFRGYKTSKGERWNYNELFYKNNKLTRNFKYMHGMEHGLNIVYHKDGTIFSTGELKHGQLHGLFTVNYKSSKTTTEYYENGKLLK